MNWEKKGQIFKVDNSNEYLLSHASNPLPVHLHNDIFRIFYSGRNADNKSSVGYVDIDIVNLNIINYPTKPVITFGNEISFYSHGISIGNLYEAKGKSYILFMGWQVEKGQHWRGDVGRIELVDKDKMNVIPALPFMTIDEEDTVSLSYPWVMFHEGIYKMWYGSTISWSSENGEMIHVIKYATSADGEIWTKHGIAIPYELGVAQAFSKPCVIVNDSGYHMWYSYRSGTGEKYRIGYAFSKNGILWERKHNEVGISVSENGWDSEMVCYPYVFNHSNKMYMLYNGNSYGKEGFGLAVLTK
jgi:hypothetical protein